jgi:antibiotic biosynthesis monooxygenase (ABM) superfamily enzyme
MQTAKPKKWKLIVLTWSIIYPLINILFILLMPFIADFNNLLKTFILTAILVPIMVVLSGIAQQKLHHWLIR